LVIAVYPGSFDPVTNGHIDILERTSPLFDKIVIAVIHNVYKQALFTLEERVNLIRESTSHLSNVEVDSFSGLLADYIKAKKGNVIIRGLRSLTDFEYESHMSMMNKTLLPDVDTIFVMSASKYIL
jgi:pantetheine-phosphate adenylyltransferase